MKCNEKFPSQHKVRLHSEASYPQPRETRLSYYDVTTKLVDLVGLCWLKLNLVEKI